MSTTEFEPHPSSALEYWFFKVNADNIALIVDWIERRKSGAHVVRASIHSPYRREVVFSDLGESGAPSAPQGSSGWRRVADGAGPLRRRRAYEVRPSAFEVTATSDVDATAGVEPATRPGMSRCPGPPGSPR